jgi:PqqD family protein of HPr-rel-A system
LTQRYLWHRWAEGSVVFDRETGSTHALSPVTSAVFLALQADPSMDDVALAARLRAQAEIAGEAPGLPEAVRDARRRLVAIGL